MNKLKNIENRIAIAEKELTELEQEYEEAYREYKMGYREHPKYSFSGIIRLQEEQIERLYKQLKQLTDKNE